MSADNDPVALLEALGLNRLEAEVYVAILASPGATAYRIGKRLNRPTANVYKAVDSLARKGALLLEEGGARACTAIPAAEFCRRAERSFSEKARRVEEALAQVETQPREEKVYHLASVEQILDKARVMLEERAQSVAVLDAFPAALRAVLGSVHSALSRGVAVFVLAYEPVEIEGANVVCAHRSAEVLAFWESQQINLAVDGREHLAALLSADMSQVHAGIWSPGLYLSCLFHGGRLCEHTLHRMLAASSKAEAAQILASHRFFLTSAVPGQQDLFKRKQRRQSK